MGGSQHEGHGQHGGGKRGRDAALTWDVPPPLETEAAATAGRPAFAAVAAKHLEALVGQLLEAEGVGAGPTWAPLVCQLAQAAAASLSPTALVAQGRLDPRYYIKVKRVVSATAAPADSSVVLGVACRKSLAHKRMRSSITQPRVMLLAGGLEAAGARGGMGGAGAGSSGLGSLGGASGAAAASKLSSFDSLLDQEQQFLDSAVARIASFNPDVLLVERSVPRYALEQLLARDVSLVLNVKLELLERIARCSGALVAPSLDQLTSHCVGFCKEFDVESMQPAGANSFAGASSAAAAVAAAAATPLGSTNASPRASDAPADGHHLVADAASLRRIAALGRLSGGPVSGGSSRALMVFRGCPRPLGATIVLRGSDAAELRRVKRVASFAAYAAYWGLLETALLSDQLAAAAAAVLPGGGGGQPEAVAGLADAVASTSFLATAEARARQAIVSASPHVSIVLEQGAPSDELELPVSPSEAAKAVGQRGPGSSGSGGDGEEGTGSGSVGSRGGGGGVWEDAAAPDSPASSDSTNMWVLPAEAGAATFTVSGSQSQTEAEEAEEGDAAAQMLLQQQREAVGVVGTGSGAGSPLGRGPIQARQLVPGSPQDPLHLAAKELALQQLQLTGSEPPSPASAALLASGNPSEQQAAAAAQAQLAGTGNSEGAVTQSSQRSSAVALGAEASAASAGREGGAGPPGLAAYRSQRLWLAISCKNPAKGILCEPSHAHCMEFYADTDLPLAAFLSAAAPPNRKCPHPQCGEGAPLHLRSFMHSNGLVTLSSMRLPAGKELADNRVWLWLRPSGAGAGAGAGDSLAVAASSATARRVPLSPEAACLSFAHLLGLLLDARHLALGGLSLQRDFVRYLGTGSTLLCLHYSPIAPYTVRMPPRQVQLLPEPELDWLQEEIKQLTEEADEAFGAIEYALGEQLDALARQQEQGAGEQQQAGEAGQVPDPGSDPEFRSMWLGTLSDTRAAFLDMVQDTITLLDSSPLGASLEQQQQTARRVVTVVWEMNRLRSMLAAVVLQWATCLHEGSPGSYAAPPSSASALNTVLASRRLAAAAGHSRHGSGEGLAGAPAVTEGQLPASPFARTPSQRATFMQQQQEAPQQQQQEEVISSLVDRQEQPQPHQVEPSLAAQQQQQQRAAPEELPAQHVLDGSASGQMRRDESGSSLAHQFLEAGSELPPASASELNFGAPSLRAPEEGGAGSLASSPPAGLPPPGGSSTATGLVARYIAMFDHRGGGSSPSEESPSGPTVLRSQRTRDWVQTSAPLAGEAEGAGAAAAAGAAVAGPGLVNVQQGGSEAAAVAAAVAADAGRCRRELLLPPLLLPKQPSFFRLDLSNPDPELVRALTPKQRSTTDEAEAEAPPSSRLEQVAARLGRMSLSKSFSERRRSFSQLGHALSADQASLHHHLQPLAEQQQFSEQQRLADQQPMQQGAQLRQQAAQPQQDVQQPQQQAAQDLGAAAGSLAASSGGVSGQALPAAAGAAEGAAAGAAGEAAGGGPLLAGEPSGLGSVSHWEWNSLLHEAGSPAEGGEGGTAEAAAAAGEEAYVGTSLVRPLSPLRMLRSTSSGRLDAITKLQEAPMPPDLPPPGTEAPAEASADAAAVSVAAMTEAAAVPAAGLATTAVVTAAAPVAAPSPGPSALPPLSSRASSLISNSLGLSLLMPSLSTQQPGSSFSAANTALPSPAHPPPQPTKQPSKLMQLLGKLRSELAPGHMPLTAGKVELSGRALLPGGADGIRVAVFDDEPTSIIAYFLATKEYQNYLHDAVAGILFGQPGANSTSMSAPADGGASASENEVGAGAVPGSWQSLPGSPRAGGRGSSLVPGLRQRREQQQQQAAQDMAAAAAAAAAAAGEAEVPAGAGDPAGTTTAAAAALAAAAAAGSWQAAPSTRTVTQEELAAEQSGDWQVLFCEQQLDCQLALEDPSPGMPWGRAKFQVTAYYAPQFAELRRRCVAGGEPAFLASISRCRKWASRGGKSAVYFARTMDKRYIVKQLSRSERQSFLEFAPDYFRYLATMLHRGQDMCLAKILGVYQVSVQYTGGKGAPSVPPFGGKEGVMDLLVTENVFYGRDAQVSRVYDLKGSQRDRYNSENPAAAGAVLLDENLKELNMSSPTLVGPRAFARLQRALWSDSSFLAGLGVMDYSLLVGVDKVTGQLIVGVIDYIRQYTWDKQVETWVKKSGILGGAGKDPTVISPKQYSRRFRVAMSSYFTVVPAWEAPEQPLDPDAM